MCVCGRSCLAVRYISRSRCTECESANVVTFFFCRSLRFFVICLLRLLSAFSSSEQDASEEDSESLELSLSELEEELDESDEDSEFECSSEPSFAESDLSDSDWLSSALPDA